MSLQLPLVLDRDQDHSGRVPRSPLRRARHLWQTCHRSGRLKFSGCAHRHRGLPYLVPLSKTSPKTSRAGSNPVMLTVPAVRDHCRLPGGVLKGLGGLNRGGFECSWWRHLCSPGRARGGIHVQAYCPVVPLSRGAGAVRGSMVRVGTCTCACVGGRLCGRGRQRGGMLGLLAQRRDMCCAEARSDCSAFRTCRYERGARTSGKGCKDWKRRRNWERHRKRLLPAAQQVSSRQRPSLHGPHPPTQPITSHPRSQQRHQLTKAQRRPGPTGSASHQLLTRQAPNLQWEPQRPRVPTV